MNLLLFFLVTLPFFICLWVKVYIYIGIKKSFFLLKKGTTSRKKRNKAFLEKSIAYVLLSGCVGEGCKDYLHTLFSFSVADIWQEKKETPVLKYPYPKTIFFLK